MNGVLRMLPALILTACQTAPPAPRENFAAAPARLDAHIESASIEEYILALPPHAFYEQSVEGFARSVREARARQPQNAGRNADYLFLPGDGTWPAQEFFLDRSRRTMTIRIHSQEPGTTVETVTMQRVPGGWKRG
jgi:hypothetical protein